MTPPPTPLLGSFSVLDSLLQHYSHRGNTSKPKVLDSLESNVPCCVGTALSCVYLQLHLTLISLIRTEPAWLCLESGEDLSLSSRQSLPC